MKYLHVWPNEKFTNAYIEFINKNFDRDEHVFLIVSDGQGFDMRKEVNVIELKSNLKGYLYVIKNMNQAMHIYIHSFFISRIVELLFIQPWLLKKCRWIIWGGDLYSYREPKITIKEKIYEYMRKKVIRNIEYIIALVKGDFDLAQKWYKTRAKYHFGVYIDSTNFEILDNYKVSKEHNEINIQIGNSGDPTNQHLEALNVLKKFREENIRIFVPLSYGGNEDYRNEIVRRGYEIFGDKFKPILDFMTIKEYSQHLCSMDIAIFNNNRQQGLGNMWVLFYMGKKVFIRSDSTMWSHFKEVVDVEVWKFEEIVNYNFMQFAEINPTNNREKIVEFDRKCDPKIIWQNIFESK